MTGLDYFSFIVLAVLIGATVWLAIVLGSLPGKIADQRCHPQADAIRVAGWFGVLTLGLLWPLALIWAHMKPVSQKEIASLRTSIDRLSERMEVALESKGAAGPDDGGTS